MWDGFVASIVKMMTPDEEGEEPNPMLMKMLMPMLPAYLMQFRGTLSIDVDEEAVAEIWETVQELAPPDVKRIVNADNSELLEGLKDLDGMRRFGNMFEGKSVVDVINMAPGPWAYMAGHDDVKTEADAIKLFTTFWMDIAATVAEGRRPECDEPRKEQMAISAIQFFSMIFGDEVSFEAFACPLTEPKGKVCWAEAGIPVAAKGLIRMEGAAQIM